MTGRKTSVIVLLLAIAILVGALVAAVIVSPAVCHHYHCP